MARFDRIIQAELTSSTDDFLFEDLRITVSTKRTSTSTPNESSVSIYNLSPATRERLIAEPWSAIIRAGYSSDSSVATICSGEVYEISTTRSGANVATTFKLNDGGALLGEFRKSFSFPKGSSAVDAIKRIASEAGIPIENAESLNTLQDKPFSAGFTSSGSLWVSMDRICARLGASWSIQNGELRISSSVASPAGDFYISSGSGLIGSPEKVKINKQDGWRIRSLLLPRLLPGDGIEVTSKGLKNVPLRVKTVTHTADNWEGDFITEIEGLMI